jgi:(3,5-dihydroxyphenyl)acetyl-CoA 1,2-dioxygenase
MVEMPTKREAAVEAARQLNQSDLEAAPSFSGSLAQDVGSARDFLSATPDTAEAREHVRDVKEAFFRRHAPAIYADLTANHTRFLRVSELVYRAAERFPFLLPTRAQIAAERALARQSAKKGLEIDQGFFIAHLLADEKAGNHLIQAMLLPKQEAEERIGEFRRTGFVDLGGATVERKGRTGQVCLTNPKFINAEDDGAMAALETAVDLVLLDKRIDVGVLRGGVLEHPKYAGRRVFNAGINLTHLYYGQISFVEFIIERELGLLNKIYRGHTRSTFWDAEIEDYAEKPWLAVVESFAIGGGCQLLCVMDRVIAEPDTYFNLPASKEGFIPGSANLRLPRLVGIQNARHGIFFDHKFHAGTAEGMMICDEVVPAEHMEHAIARNAAQMVRAGVTSTVSNRKALRVGQEPLGAYRRYMATYSRQQCLCMYDQALIDNLEQNWQPQRRRI